MYYKFFKNYANIRIIKYTIIKYYIIYFCSLTHACHAMILSEERDNIGQYYYYIESKK